MYSLADPALGMRCAFALGLRTLTLQTGRAFRDLLGLGDDDLAIRVGGSASRALFEHYEAIAEASGSASNQNLLDEDSHVLFDGQEENHPLLRRAIADSQVRALLSAPILVCTIDHLTPATERQRGGRQIAPMLRLMSGDLVLDEPDDFDLDDLPALTRLVHWAGLLGARLLLSSATLPPALLLGLFEAYRNGRAHFQRNRSDRPGGAEAPPNICCAWVDEFKQLQCDCSTPMAFEENHLRFATQRHAELSKQAKEPRRRAELIQLPKLPKDLQLAAPIFAARVVESAADLHRHHHAIDPKSGKRVSFGLVRMANIEPLFEVALAAYRMGAPTGLRIHLCIYHSRFPLLIRSAIERQLDAALQRHDPEAVFSLPDIRQRLDVSSEMDQLFIVLGSPVTEVGRDHDYDWAVVEPSSMRSLIQLSGRVRRHRTGVCSVPNVRIFSSNLRSFQRPDQAAFCRPGFEQDSGKFRLTSHDLNTLLSPDEYAVIDSRPRIVARPELKPQERLVDLEHSRLQHTMSVQSASPPTIKSGQRTRGSQTAPAPLLNASTWWNEDPADALLTALLPQQQRFRDDTGRPDVELVLLPDEDDERCVLHRVTPQKGGQWPKDLYAPVERAEHHPIPDVAVQGVRIEPWGVADYMQALSALAGELAISLTECAKRYGKVTVSESEGRGWRSHPALGFSKAQEPTRGRS
jgi:CRISPR-associated endonuclease/helicase Cas3